MIKRALQALDGHERAIVGTPEKMNPSIQVSLFQGSAVVYIYVKSVKYTCM